MKKIKVFILMMILFVVSACNVTKSTSTTTTKSEVTSKSTVTSSVKNSSTSLPTNSTKASSTESKSTSKQTTLTTTTITTSKSTTSKPSTSKSTTSITTKSAYELISETFAYFAFNFNGNDSEANGVTENFTLSLMDTNGVTLSYTSDSDAIKIVGNEAVVTRKKADTVVTIKVTGSYKGESYSINIKLTVIKKEQTINDGDLYFSEYIEATKGNDKFLEIYNNTGTDIDLSEYTVKTFSKDSSNTDRVLSLSGIIKDGDVIVIAHTDYNGSIKVAFKSTVCYFSGTHAIALYHDDELIDIIGGPIGSSGTTYQDFLTNTGIERNGSLIKGNEVFDESEWTAFADTDLSGLGIAPEGEEVTIGVVYDLSKLPKNVTLNGNIPNFWEYAVLKEDGVLVNLTSKNFDLSNLDVTKIGNYQIKFNYTDKNNKQISETINVAVVDASYLLTDHDTIQDAIDRNAFGEDYVYNVLPSTGEVNVLVIPIQFTSDLFTQAELEMINKGFFGENLSFESLKSFYLKSSYGKLTIGGEVLAPVTVKETPNYYKDATVVEDGITYSCGVDILIEEAIAYYLSVNPSLDLSKYDSDDDGYFDAVHFIYSCDYSSDLENDDFYWAYQYFYYPSDSDYGNIININGIEVSAYVFSSVEFFYEDEGGSARTIIHETGHLFGLDDYYDYTEYEGVSGGLGGADMMDDTCGDHNAFSKIMLGWVDPIVVNSSCEITLNKFSLTGDTILLAPNFSSLFSEYILISYFTPTELNADNYYLDQAGLIVYHVNAQLITKDNDYYYSNYFKYNNSDADKHLIKIVEADSNNSIAKTSTADNNDLLKANQTLNLSLSDGKVFATIKLNSISETQVTVSINFVQ